ncbi:coiled-coil and C2 domain-containing protein 1B [Aplochiton taeniatus]
MFGKKKRAPLPKGQGAAAAKQMGLFLDINQEDMMGMDGNLDDPDLEAELAAITGNSTAAGGRAKQKAKTPLPMEDIARMADECMKDFDDDNDDDASLEDDEDLLAELQEVVGEEMAEDDVALSPTSLTSVKSSPAETPDSPPQHQEARGPSLPGSLQHTLEERVIMYKSAVKNAKTSGEMAKARRYDRGLKTLELMLTSVKKGVTVNEAEIPPPVSSGVPSAPTQTTSPATAPSQPVSPEQQREPEAAVAASPVVPEILEPGSEEEVSSSASLSTLNSHPITEKEEEEGAFGQVLSPQAKVGEATSTMLLERQKEYRTAALRAKQQGQMEQAKLYIRTSKKFDAVIEALGKGQAVDLSGLPPSPANVPVPPRNVLEALEQRRAKYEEASTQAKASGDDRKARMHDRIAKQYQSAIRSHKAGKAVNYEELPVPPGFPPIPGQAAAGADQGFAAVLEAADKLTSTEATEIGDEDGEEEEKGDENPPVPAKPKKPMLAVVPMAQPSEKSPASSRERKASRESISSTAAQQLDFLEGRRKQYMAAALQAKQKKDMEQAKQFLRTAKSFEPMIEAARRGKAVDISKVPSPPGDEDEDFILVHHADVQISEKAEELYTQLAKILKEQYEKCMTYSKQFTHLGNITETTKFEKLADSCKKSIEMLKLSQAKGLDPPQHHFEQRTYNTVRMFPELSSTEMVVMVVKGMNLPAPHGIQPNDLDAYVKFDFPYPSTEQPQRHRTSVIKNSNSPEFNQSFKLNISRNHRGFRRVVQSKGLKLEVLHKGGFLRSDKPVGTAMVKLEKLETQSEVREIVEIMDGRKATGGRVEVKVRLREPLSGQDLQTATERWLVLDQSQVTPAASA